MWSIEYAELQRPYPQKNHDRVFVDAERNIYGVFDGANNPYASYVAVDTLKHAVMSEEFTVVKALEDVNTRLIDEFRGQYLTTGSLVYLQKHGDNLEYSFAAAGDSPVYSYDHAQQRLYRETLDTSLKHGITYVDVNDFLGLKKDKVKQLGVRVLQADATFVIVSDGITDQCYDGHLTDKDIEQIVAQPRTVGETAQAILDQTAEFDDATVLVVRALQTK